MQSPSVRPLNSRTALLAASKLVSLGFPVIWLRSPTQKTYFSPKTGPYDVPPEKRGKAPVATGWASQDALGIEELAGMLGDGEPGYNVGIRTGNVSGAATEVIAVDLDTSEALMWAMRHLPETQIKTHTAKGQHWFFRKPPRRVGNKVRVDVGGAEIAIDVRGDGGLVVAPSSVHGTGAVYRGVLPWTPERVASMPLFDPAWFGEAQWEGGEDPKIADGGERKPPRYVDYNFRRKRALAYLDHTPGTISGQGTASNDCLTVARALVFGLCIPPQEAARILHDHDWNNSCLDEHGQVYRWTYEELLHKANDAYRLHYDKPYGFLLLEERGEAAPPTSKSEEALMPAAREMAAAAREIEQREIEAYWWDFAVEEQEVEDPGKRGWPLTDTGNAERLVSRFGESVRFAEDREVWYAWDQKSGRWVLRKIALQRCSKITARKIVEEFPAAEERVAVAAAAVQNVEEGTEAHAAAAEKLDEAQDALESLQKWQRASESAAKRSAMVELAAAEHSIAVGSDCFDRHPFLINVRNGILDLSGEEPKLLPHDRDMYMTKVCLVDWDPKAEAPTWQKCLRDWTGGDETLIAYLQRVMGYAATGSTEEEVCFFFHGVGANGKSTFLNACHSVMGPYAVTAPAGLLMETRVDKATPSQQAGVAALVGCRLVIASETDETARLSEAQVKAITCKDRVSAKRMHEAPFEFTPSHHVFLMTNSKPGISGTDDGIWRRIHLMEWLHRVAPCDRDNKLAEKLMAERSGILRWIVEGCAAWQKLGLAPPAAIEIWRQNYRKEQDTLGLFLSDNVELADGCLIMKQQLRSAYETWCEENGYMAFGAKKFSEQMARRGVGDGGKAWLGVRFKGASVAAAR